MVQFLFRLFLSGTLVGCTLFAADAWARPTLDEDAVSSVGDGVIRRIEWTGKTGLLPSNLNDLIGVGQHEHFDQRKIDSGLMRIKEELFRQGFLKAQASVSELAWSEGKEEVDVRINVDAGEKYRIEVVGDTFFTAREIKNRIWEKVQKSGVSDRVFDQLRYQLQAAYRKVGFARVEVQLEEISLAVREGDISRSLRCSIDEGKQILIDAISVEGAQYVSNDELGRKAIGFIQSHFDLKGIFGPVDKYDVDELVNYSDSSRHPDQVQVFDGTEMLDKGWLPFDAGMLTQVKDHLRQFYLAAGFLDVRVIGPQSNYSSAGRFVQIRYQVIEGVQTLVGRIELVSSTTLLLSDWVENPLVVSGKPLNGVAIESQRKQIEHRFWNSGYPFARVKSEVLSRIDDDRADVFYHVDLGAKIHVSQIDIVGNELTKFHVIERRMKINAGDLFSLEKIAESRSRLLQTDLFSDVNIYLDPNDGNNENRRLIVDVQERRRTTLELGVGASLEDGPRVIGVMQRRNLFGLGLGLRARLQLNYPALFYRMPFFYPSQVIDALESRFEKAEGWARPLLFTEGKILFGLQYPKVPVVPFDADASLDLSAAREIRPAYNLNKLALQLGVASNPTSWMHVTPQVEVEYANFNCPLGYRVGYGCGDRTVGMARRLDAGVINQFTFRVLSSVDRRDNPIRPRSGYSFELNGDVGLGKADLINQELASSDPDRSRLAKSIAYFKLVTGFNLYVPLMRRLVWSFSAKVGNLMSFADDGYVPLFKRFYLGGTSSIRGFAEDQILPADDENWPYDRPTPIDPSKSSLSLGGHFFTLVRSEIRFPIYGDVEGGVFVDVGELLRKANNWTFAALAMGSGFGIRYQTPIGPLIFDIGVRIFDGERIFAPSFWNLFGIHFSIGYS